MVLMSEVKIFAVKKSVNYSIRALRYLLRFGVLTLSLWFLLEINLDRQQERSSLQKSYEKWLNEIESINDGLDAPVSSASEQQPKDSLNLRIEPDLKFANISIRLLASSPTDEISYKLESSPSKKTSDPSLRRAQIMRTLELMREANIFSYNATTKSPNNVFYQLRVVSKNSDFATSFSAKKLVENPAIALLVKLIQLYGENVVDVAEDGTQIVATTGHK